jgi:cellulose synthase/poly-beta-1,6-N-acetylglucosamine synthase-like glycosyltransferase
MNKCLLLSTYMYTHVHVLKHNNKYDNRCIYWLQLWVGQHRRVCPLWKLSPKFPSSEWPLCEVVIAHYQEPTDEIAGTLRAALEMDYPHDKFIVSILDDGYFRMVEQDYVVTAGGKELEAMVIAM